MAIDTREACTRCGAQMIQEDGLPERCDACEYEMKQEADMAELAGNQRAKKRKAHLAENPETVCVEPR